MVDYAELREEVDRRLDRLRTEYGEFPIEEEIVRNDPDFFEHGRGLVAEEWRGDGPSSTRRTRAGG